MAMVELEGLGWVRQRGNRWSMGCGSGRRGGSQSENRKQLMLARVRRCHLLAASFGALVFYLAFLAFNRSDPVHIIDQSITGVRGDPIRPGSTVAIRWVAEGVRPQCSGYIRRRMVSATQVVYEFENVTSVLQYSNSKAFERVLTLPISFAPGKATYEARGHYYCNWVQRVLDWPVVISRTPITFMVEP